MTNKLDPARKSRIDGFIADMKQAPKAFFDAGTSYDLLKEFYYYDDRACLIPLLQSDDVYIKRVTIWVVSELAKDAADLVDYVIPLIRDSDRATACYAYESLTSISDVNDDVARYIVSAMKHSDAVIRELGMFILSNISDSNLIGARAYFSAKKKSEQKAGLDILLDNAEAFDNEFISLILSKKDDLQTRFLCSALRRNKVVIENKLLEQFSNYPDEAVRLFASRYLKTSEAA